MRLDLEGVAVESERLDGLGTLRDEDVAPVQVAVLKFQNVLGD